MKFLNPEQKKLYDQAREELGPPFRDWIPKVQEILLKAGVKVNDAKLSKVRNGIVQDWTILNAIRALRGLPIIEPMKGPSVDEIANQLKLQVA